MILRQAPLDSLLWGLPARALATISALINVTFFKNLFVMRAEKGKLSTRRGVAHSAAYRHM